MSLPSADAFDHASRSHHGPRFDGTINIPTLLMLIAMIAGMVASGMGLYSSLSQRIDAGARDNALLKNQVDDIKADQARARADMRGDLHDINTKLDKLLWDRGDRGAGVRGTP